MLRNRIPTPPVAEPAPRADRGVLSPAGVMIATLCCLLWAGAYQTGKYAIGTPGMPGFGPFRLAFLRFGLGGAILLLWGLWRTPKALVIAKEDRWALFRVGLLGMCLTYTFNYAGLARSTGTAAALIMATEPVWIAALAVLFLKERLTPPRVVGIVAGLVGALLVVVSTARTAAAVITSASALQMLLGNGLMALSLLWESGAVLTAKRLTARYPGPIIVYEFVIGAILLAPFALYEQVHDLAPLHPSPAAWASFAYLVIGCTLIAYTLWFKLLETADASNVTVFIFLQPVVGAMIGLVWLHDPFTRLTLVGALLVVVALIAIAREGRR